MKKKEYCNGKVSSPELPSQISQSNVIYSLVNNEKNEGHLSEELLSTLRDSEELRNRLKDPTLQEIIKRIDSSEDREQELKKTLNQDPDFLLFIRKMVKVLTGEEVNDSINVIIDEPIA